MQQPAIPDNELQRLQALYQCQILDTSPDERFDRLTRMCARQLQCPIAVVSLVDAARQWFKSTHGLGVAETPRHISFCGHAILADGIFEIPDARQDVRFADNPLVTGPPNIVFYAGFPLCTEEGFNIGTLCVIDSRPRHLSEDERQWLRDLGASVLDQVLLNRALNDSLALIEHRAQLQSANRQLQNILDGTRIGTWEWNVQTGETFFNERWAEIIGYRLEELEPVSIQTWMNYAHPDDLLVSGDLLQRHFSGELEYYDCKCRMRHKSGNWVWVHDRGRVMSWTQDQKPLLMYGTHADITELMQVRQSLEEQQKQLHSMLGNMPGAAYRYTNDGKWKLSFVSDAIFDLTGYAAENFLSQAGAALRLMDLVDPRDLAIVEKYHQQESYHSDYQIEYRIRHNNGQIVWVQEFSRGAFDAAGNLMYLDGFIWNIAARKRAEMVLREQQVKLSSLYQMAPIGIALNRYEDGRFLEANPELYLMLGYTPQEFHGMEYQDITPELWRESDAHIGELIKTQGRYGPYEKQFICKDGRLLDVSMSGVVVQNAQGDNQIWSIIQDISKYKQLEKMKSELVAVVSHELRTPLTSVIGALGLIRKTLAGGALPNRQVELLEIAYSNSQRLNMLVNDLLDMEKLIAGKMIFKMEVQRLSDLLQQALRDNRSYADHYKVKLLLRAPSDTLGVRVDGLRFAQVMSNLISNACKFSPANSEVEIWVEVSYDTLRILVRDHGPGIPLEYRGRIFQKFSQADSSAARKREGTGLGLAITRELVERMEGAIGFDSLPGRGATFFITLPSFLLHGSAD